MNFVLFLSAFETNEISWTRKKTKISMIKPSIMTTLAITSFLPIAIAIGNWTQFPNINIATKEMFHNTERLQPLSDVDCG